MFVDSLPRNNPYRAFAAVVRGNGLYSGRGVALFQPEDARLANLLAPSLASKMMAQAGRLEGLSGKLSSLRDWLAQLADPANTPRLQACPAQAAGSTETLVGATAPVIVGTDAVRLAPGTPATAGTLTMGGVALNTSNATPATQGTMTLNPVTLNTNGVVNATYATMTTGPVGINLSTNAPATMTGGTITLTNNSTDFGTLTINGHTTTLGTFSGNNTKNAATFVMNAINADSSAAVTATVSQSSNHVVLTSKVSGRTGNFTVDSVTGAGSIGFVSGDAATGTDGSTDFGSVTIGGVTTSLGLVSNTNLTTQSAAQALVNKLNANASNVVTASVGGTNHDQIVLTAKTIGTAGNFTVSSATNDSNAIAGDDGTNGFTAGQSAMGVDDNAGKSDFGSVTINGITTSFGVLDNNLSTSASAAWYLADRINATNQTVTAWIHDGRLQLTGRTTGSHQALSVDAVAADSDGNPSNNGVVGLAVGKGEPGTDTHMVTTATNTEGAGGQSPADASQVAAMVARAGSLTSGTNDFLASVSEELKKGLTVVKGVGDALDKTFKGMEARLGAVGLSYSDGKLTLDQSKLSQALSQDLAAATAAFGTLRQALEPALALQQATIDHVREASLSISKNASEVAKAAIAVYRVDARSQNVVSLLDQMQKAQQKSREQEEKLKKHQEDLQASEKKDEKTPGKASKDLPVKDRSKDARPVPVPAPGEAAQKPEPVLAQAQPARTSPPFVDATLSWWNT